MSDIDLTIFVEGNSDVLILRNLLAAARLDIGVDIIPCNGKQRVAEIVKKLHDTPTHKFLALVDADEMSVADAAELAASQLGHPAIPVFCAVPTAEAWLFADDVTALKAARDDKAALMIKRLPLPEMITYPKRVASTVFRKTANFYNFSFLQEIDINRAAARSPSLRAFLGGVAKAQEKNFDLNAISLGTTINRDVISTLLRELPRDQVAWKTLDGDVFKAEDLARAVSEGTEPGRQYATELLRVARDLIVRKSQR